MNYIDKVANLLATENLSVVRRPVQTASFDVKSRVLTLPQWKDMSTDLETMLVGHEIGHALYTSLEMLESTKEMGRGFHSFVNVIEDARIEKLVKRLYPGMKKYFISGYKDLNQRDLFGTKGQNLNELAFIDRINLYFKLGIFCGVKFNSEELPYVKRIELAETAEEVLQLARELYDSEKEKMEEQQKQLSEQMKQIASEDGEEDEQDLDDEDYEESDDYENESDDDFSQSVGSDESLEAEEDDSEHTYSDDMPEENTKDPISKTQENMNKNIQEMADPDSIYTEYELLDADNKFDPVIGYKTILEETANPEIPYWLSEDSIKQVGLDFDKFMQNSTKIVNYLVKQFELKKSADQYKRSKISKSGSLDMKKIFAYKLKDDIFKQITTIADSKNHGMVFLLDWSGSMNNVLHDTIKQLIPLAMFCRKTHIPFRVIAFSDYYNSDEYNSSRYYSDTYRDLFAANKIPANDNFRLLEFLSSDMSNKDFTEMCRRLFDTQKFHTCNGENYRLHGTPLNDALRYMLKYVPEFIRSSNIQKMTLVSLTDGESFQSLRYLPTHTEEGKRVTNFIIDPVTKKRYKAIRDYHNKGCVTETNMFIDMLKSRHDVKVVGFFVCPNTSSQLGRAIYMNRADLNTYYSSDVSGLVVDAKQSFRASGYYNLQKTPRDAMFIVPINKLKDDNEELLADDSMTASKLARQFTKFMTKQTTSRIFLDRFVDIIA